MLGLPDAIRACLFDLDGVLTKTATVHFAAWKRTFDEFLSEHEPGSEAFSQLDYNRYVDGKHRADGVRGFLASRGITLPEGSPHDPPDAATVQGIAVLLLTPTLVAGVIADERQRKTLHYLLASRLSSGEIILGKLAARLLHVGVFLGLTWTPLAWALVPLGVFYEYLVIKRIARWRALRGLRPPDQG